ncbi:MAG TPA: MvaI/BcnI family restriction endonuclease [Candidatus Dojkabacteria bacterium]|mgnify:CR=1 FL=1|nr:MvaI/BcnI family restriction endonuclease [Candidatus Dojkabacteria bacterium]
MNLKELVEKLQAIRGMGYVKALRKGNTGIGYTFESLIGLDETNIPIPDIGGRVEIKTTRKDSSSLVTLFTFNRGVWIRRQKEIIEQFGYEDEKGRKALKSTIFFNKPNSLGLFIEIDESKNVIRLLSPNNELLAEWDVYVVVGVFSSKLSRLLFVLADRRTVKGQEEFHFNEAYLLTEPNPRNFLKAFKNSLVGIDLRMHLKENGTVRNRGTGFRMHEKDMLELYGNKRKIL